MPSLMIDFIRPCIHGLLILMTICCHPPPVFFLVEFIFKLFDMEIAFIAFNTILSYPFLKFARQARRKVQLYPHTSLRIFPDCAVIFPARFSICTALILRNEYATPLESHFPQEFLLEFPTGGLQIGSSLCFCLAVVSNTIWQRLTLCLFALLVPNFVMALHTDSKFKYPT